MNDLHTAAAQQAMDRTNYGVTQTTRNLGAEPDRDLRVIIRRLHEMIAGAYDIADRLHTIADRIKGPLPECKNEAATGYASGGSGDLAEIHALIDVLMNNLTQTTEGVLRIESL